MKHLLLLALLFSVAPAFSARVPCREGNKVIPHQREFQSIAGGPERLENIVWQGQRIPDTKKALGEMVIPLIITYTKNGKTYERYCGSGLVDQIAVVIAPHCLIEDPDQPQKYISPDNVTGYLNGKPIYFNKDEIHENFTPTIITKPSGEKVIFDAENDVGLLFLTELLPENVRMASLPLDTYAVNSGEALNFISVGETEEGKGDFLVQTSSGEKVSNKTFSAVNAIPNEDPRLLQVNKALCRGDSGGLLLNDTGLLVGTASFGKCGREGFVTNMAIYSPWIREKIEAEWRRRGLVRPTESRDRNQDISI